MIFQETSLPGAFVIDVERREDERGFFARTFCEAEFRAHGLPAAFPQANLSHNRSRGTLRGMHYQVGKHEESKLVRCVRGSVYDIIVDLRPESPTRFRSLGVELSAESGRALFVPVGFGHGFLTLTDEADVFYLMGDSYRPGSARGFRWDDPRFALAWPLAPAVVTDRDSSYPDFDPEAWDR